MAGSQTEIVANQIGQQRKGFLAISLTNYDADTEPQIAAGSSVEIAGALFLFPALESITGWAGIGINNDVYVKLVVSGTSVTAEFTTTAPTWSDSKQGWYGTAGAALHRYVVKLRKDGSGNYTLKRLMLEPGRTSRIRVAEQISDDVIERAKILSAAINATKVDFTLTAGGFVNTGVAWVVPAGLYMICVTAGGANLEVFQGGAWRSSGTFFPGGAVFSDGANVRLIGSSGAIQFYYLGLA